MVLQAQDSDIFGPIRNQPSKAGAIIIHLKQPLSPDQKIYITGSHYTLGNWNPKRVAMSCVDSVTFFHGFDGAMPDSAGFKITTGTWDHEMLQDGQKKGNLSYTRGPKIYEYWDVEFSKKNASQSKPSIGNIIHLPQVADSTKRIQPRDCWIWTPNSYDPEMPYDFLILHDGQNLIDPSTSNYGIEWRVDETSDSLQSGGYTRPFIVVGINNTSDREREYMGDLTTGYVDWIANQLLPAVNVQTPLPQESKYIFTGGSSAGGAISFVMHTQYTENFGGALCMSPALFYKGFNCLTPFVDGPMVALTLYIDNGGLELEKVLQPSIDYLLQNLENKGYQSPREYIYISDPLANHSEEAWAKRLPNALIYLLPPLDSSH